MRTKPKLRQTLRWLKFELREVNGEKNIFVLSNHGHEGTYSSDVSDAWEFALRCMLEKLDEEVVGHHQLGDLWSE